MAKQSKGHKTNGLKENVQKDKKAPKIDSKKEKWAKIEMKTTTKNGQQR